MLTLNELAGDSVDETPRIAGSNWDADGMLIVLGLIPDPLIDAYCDQFINDAADRARSYHEDDAELAAGYGIGTPYMAVRELRDIALYERLTFILDRLLGETMALHLNLTGWRSTTRQWHQDQYLNPPCVGNFYAATWVALDDISPDAGPFEFVRGSHRWPAIDQAKMLAAMGEDGTDPDWPWRSETILGPLFDAEIEARGGKVEQFMAQRGDVLIWHPNLCHRGSAPNNPALERRALISHYSAISHRCDMVGRERHWKSEYADGYYFDLGG